MPFVPVDLQGNIRHCLPFEHVTCASPFSQVLGQDPIQIIYMLAIARIDCNDGTLRYIPFGAL